MMQEAKPGRQIVSMGEYLQAQGMRMSMALSAIILTMIAALCGMGALFCGFGTIVCSFILKEPLTIVVPVLGASLMFAFFAYLSGRVGLYGLMQAAQIEVGVPLTRANTAAFSTNASLVRPSQEPAQAQESILLRAAAYSPQPQNKEQLLRASAGQ